MCTIFRRAHRTLKILNQNSESKDLVELLDLSSQVGWIQLISVHPHHLEAGSRRPLAQEVNRQDGVLCRLGDEG